MTYTAETLEFERDGVKRRILIQQDPCPLNPRDDFDPPSVMLCWGRYGYSDGEKNPYRYPSDFETAWSGDEEAGEEADEDLKDAVRLPISYYSHGATMYWAGTPNDPWDSGQCGWIYCTRKTIEDEWGTEPDSDGVTPDERAIAYMTHEVKTFSDWAQGNTWTWHVERFLPACDHGHSAEWIYDDSIHGCGGYIGEHPEYGGAIYDACEACDIPVPDEFKEKAVAA